MADRLWRRLGAGPIASGDVVVVALSGGVDSVALLHLLRFPLRGLGLELRAAHVDHAMRPGSAGDAAWVRGLCTAWGVPLETARLDPPARSEADARERRYAFLDEATPAGAWVLTAHHRDDQAETVLFRAARGTGVRGLRGIAPRRGRIVRPLLGFGRAEIRAYAEAAGLGWRVDPTNRDVALARNRIRHEVLPALERARPGAARSLARLAERARAWERAWSAALERLEADVVLEQDPAGATLARGVLQSYHRDLRARVLRHVLRRYGSTPDRAGTHAALEFISSGPSGGELHLRGGVRLERDFERIRVTASPRTDGTETPDAPLTIDGPGPGRGRAVVGGRAVDVVWGRGGPGPGITVPLEALPVTVRGWRPGDRIRFDYGSKKLKKLFAERRLDRQARRRTPLVVDATGRVLWVVGVARAEGVGEEGEGLEITVADVG
ncbi:MAG: tRNA lysidine(34) synthetase TilS [Longimicrobiales bacterium]|nr:tRNA lysidine(34) synthetase TilS [Longimicrobiales bacterium]